MIASFIIPALNEEKHLARCLSSIRALRRPEAIHEVEIVVVDNLSTDGTVAVAQHHGATVIEVEPGSVSRARNRGAQAAQGDFLAFVDADCELDGNWLARLFELFQDPKVMAAGTTLAPPEEGASWVEKTWYRLAHAAPESETRPVDWLASFNLLVRKEAFLGCGGFDETLVTCEDVDLSYRLSRLGILIRDATVRTRHHGESKRLDELFRREAWRGRGSLRSLVKSHFAWRELRSVLAPLGFAFLSLSGVAAIIWSVAAQQGSVGLLGLALIVGAAGIPGLAVAQKLASPWRCAELARAWLLLSTYLIARTVGLFGSVQRVSTR